MQENIKLTKCKKCNVLALRYNTGNARKKNITKRKTFTAKTWLETKTRVSYDVDDGIFAMAMICVFEAQVEAQVERKMKNETTSTATMPADHKRRSTKWKNS